MKRVTRDRLEQLADLNHKPIELDHEAGVAGIAFVKVGRVVYYANLEDKETT